MFLLNALKINKPKQEVRCI